MTDELFPEKKFVKNSDHKERYSLIPPHILRQIAKCLTYGAKKYSANNWYRCEDSVVYYDAAMRHVEAHRMGEHVDKESGLDHLTHAATDLILYAALELFSDYYCAENMEDR